MPKSGAPTGAPFFLEEFNMAFRVVFIENEVTIKVKLNNLIVTKGGEDVWIPLDDISMIIMDNLSSMLSARLLCQLSEEGIGFIICNQEHLPTGYYSAYDNHSRASKVLGFQIKKSREFYDVLWKQIVEVKICNQAQAYLLLKKDETGANYIMSFSEDVENGDKTNREAHAAKVYFNLLMGTSFSRGNEDILLNSGLDYGYAIIRSYISRVCVGYGLNTQIGIHHKSEYNRFNLVDDLLEPLRPIVDMVAFTIMKDDEYFTSNHRRQLINILNLKFVYRNKKMYIGNMIENYVEQYASFIMGRCDKIIFPDINYFIGEETDEV
jgi:CRISPR-associated protein Cas1